VGEIDFTPPYFRKKKGFNGEPRCDPGNLLKPTLKEPTFVENPNRFPLGPQKEGIMTPLTPKGFGKKKMGKDGTPN